MINTKTVLDSKDLFFLRIMSQTYEIGLKTAVKFTQKIALWVLQICMLSGIIETDKIR